MQKKCRPINQPNKHTNTAQQIKTLMMLLALVRRLEFEQGMLRISRFKFQSALHTERNLEWLERKEEQYRSTKDQQWGFAGQNL